jgi:hypothetical protein
MLSSRFNAGWSFEGDHRALKGITLPAIARYVRPRIEEGAVASVLSVRPHPIATSGRRFSLATL